jgi:hypothetical protein
MTDAGLFLKFNSCVFLVLRLSGFTHRIVLSGLNMISARQAWISSKRESSDRVSTARQVHRHDNIPMFEVSIYVASATYCLILSLVSKVVANAVSYSVKR